MSEKVRMKTPATPAEVSANYETFMSHLLEDLPPIINERFYQMYTEAWAYVEDELGAEASEGTQWKQTLQVFQTMMGEIPNWTSDRIDEETECVMREMPFLRECLRQMLVARVSILMCVRNDQRSHGNFEFVMPADQDIVHKFFCRCARRLRGRAKLYSHLVSEEEREENTLEVEDVIRECLEKAIPALVPLKEVVRVHLVEPPEPSGDEDDQPAEQDFSELVPDKDSSSSSSSSSSSEFSSVHDSPEEFSGGGGEEDEPEPRRHEAGGGEVPLAKEDMPADKGAARMAVYEGDSKNTVKLKRKAAELVSLIENLEHKLERIPPRQKSVIRATKEEIKYRKEQLHKTKKTLKKIA